MSRRAGEQARKQASQGQPAQAEPGQPRPMSYTITRLRACGFTGEQARILYEEGWAEASPQAQAVRLAQAQAQPQAGMGEYNRPYMPCAWCGRVHHVSELVYSPIELRHGRRYVQVPKLACETCHETRLKKGELVALTRPEPVRQARPPLGANL